ncbi:MAG: tRNA preQ1(34) S-adenosylmethionine ribosyltransferase-isomerase QueA [Desulfobacteraceae bacterium]|nr:tRNA preQ1(34) S-adenosylmethionine ribosyltransferase-isomerase QueA [Desulfobacteraceae bacterium]
MEGSRDCSFLLDDYDYRLPPELIAQHPASRREDCRLLIFDRSGESLVHSRFREIGEYLRPGDLLVVNDTRVVPARLLGKKQSGGRIELLVLDPYKPAEAGDAEGYCCLVKASKGVKSGQSVSLNAGFSAEISTPLGDGKALVKFAGPLPLLGILEKIGEVPLPPYITRNAAPAPVDDHACYQTEYARCPGAVAAPTAGLHFSKPLLAELEGRGVRVAAITLHVGYGTFAPVRCEDIREHRIHSEFVSVDGATADAVNRAKSEGRRIVAVGTTVVRTLEWIHARFGRVAAFTGMCDHYIYPGYRFGIVDCLVTNFHLPKSSLIILVSAFAGRSGIMAAYAEAVKERYRFFSYGDAMLIF